MDGRTSPGGAAVVGNGMKTMWTVAVAAGLMLGAAPALAQNADGGTHVRAAVTAGTMGIGPEVGVCASTITSACAPRRAF